MEMLPGEKGIQLRVVQALLLLLLVVVAFASHYVEIRYATSVPVSLP